MSASVPEATTDYSTGSEGSGGSADGPSRARQGLVALAFLAAVMLVVSTFLTLIVVTTGEATLDTRSGLDQHSIAMLLLGVAVVPMGLGALRGARPAMAGLLVIGAVALLLAFTVDLPAALNEGIYGERYEGASAKPAVGFYVETLAGVFLVLAGGLLLLAGGGRRGALADAP
jgi:ABC-type phosphate transport system permease subunit